MKRMWREVAGSQGLVTRDQLPEIPYAKAGKDPVIPKIIFCSSGMDKTGAYSTSVLDRNQKQV